MSRRAPSRSASTSGPTRSARSSSTARTDASLGTRVFDYPSGDQGVLLDPKQPHLARQNPADYIDGPRASSVGGALADGGRASPGFSRERVIGIGVDTTGSTPLPVDAQARPLALRSASGQTTSRRTRGSGRTTRRPRKRRAITETATRARAGVLLAPIGGTYSSEWWWSKIWHCLKRRARRVRRGRELGGAGRLRPGASSSGVNDSRQIVRCICAAGHKAMYSEAWGGLPSKAFLARLDPKLAELRDRLYDKAWPPGRPAGRLSRRVGARRSACAPGIAIAMGGFDAHYGAVGSGVSTGTLVKIIGTSTCDCADRARGRPASPTSPASAASSTARSCRTTSGSKRGSRRSATS